MLRRRGKEEDLTLSLGQPAFKPRTAAEAQKALELGVIDISEYVEHSLSMEPVIDALEDPDPEVRRRAIFDLLRHPRRPWAVAKLKELTESLDEDTRLYASEALEQLDSAYFQAFERLQRRYRISGSNKDRLLLALLYLDYFESGLPGKSLGSWYLQRAIRLASEALDSDPASAQAYHVRGKLWKALGHPKKAVDDLREALRLRPAEPKIYIDLAEAFYLLGDYDSVAHSCRYASQAPLPEELDEVVAFWLEEAS